MAKKSKDTIIKALQNTLATYDVYIPALETRQSQLIQIIEDGYKNCPTYYYQEEKVDFMTKLYNLNNSVYDSQKQQNLRLKDRLRTALLQLQQQGIEETDICDFQIEELRDRIRLLSGKVENRDETITILQKEISEYQHKVAELQLALSRQGGSPEIEELKKQLSESSTLADQYRNQIQNLLLVHTTLLQQILQFQTNSNMTQKQINEVLTSIITTATPSESAAPILPEPQNPPEEIQMLKDRICELEMELSSISDEKPQYGRPPKLSQEDTAQILSLVQTGWSYRKISNTYGYSLGTISRICQKNKGSKNPN